MPVFVYRAVTAEGKIVRNRVEEINRKALIKKLRRNNLYPINIVQAKKSFNIAPKQKQKKNVKDLSEMVESSDMYVNIDINSKKKERFH